MLVRQELLSSDKQSIIIAQVTRGCISCSRVASCSSVAVSGGCSCWQRVRAPSMYCAACKCCKVNKRTSVKGKLTWQPEHQNATLAIFWLKHWTFQKSICRWWGRICQVKQVIVCDFSAPAISHWFPFPSIFRSEQPSPLVCGRVWQRAWPVRDSRQVVVSVWPAGVAGRTTQRCAAAWAWPLPAGQHLKMKDKKIDEFQILVNTVQVKQMLKVNCTPKSSLIL